MKKQTTGTLLVIGSAVSWGINGILLEQLKTVSNMSVEWNVSVRLLIAGAVLLLFSVKKHKKQTFSLFRAPKSIVELMLFSFIGIAAMQYTFFYTITSSNAATAIILQYVFPVLVMAAVCVGSRRFPSAAELLSVLLALAGIFLIATHGDTGSLAISQSALVWGLVSAVCFAFYTVFPSKLLKQYGDYPVLAFSMLFGGIALAVTTKAYREWYALSPAAVLYLILTVVMGSLLPLAGYMKGVQLIGGIKSSLYSTIEPMTVVVLSALFLGRTFNLFDILGYACILSIVLLAATHKTDAGALKKKDGIYQ